MAKKKTDTYEEAKEQGTSLDAFVIPQRIRAFADAYEPCQERLATESFDETRLRNFFKAWPTSLGDPLTLYLDALECHGFKLQVGRSGELSIFVVEKMVGDAIRDLLPDSETMNAM